MKRVGQDGRDGRDLEEGREGTQRAQRIEPQMAQISQISEWMTTAEAGHPISAFPFFWRRTGSTKGRRGARGVVRFHHPGMKSMSLLDAADQWAAASVASVPSVVKCFQPMETYE